MIETRDGYGLLVDPTKIDRAEVEPHRLDHLDAWIEAQGDLSDAEAECDGTKLELETALQSRVDWVAAYGQKFAVSFREVWEASRHRGGQK